MAAEMGSGHNTARRWASAAVLLLLLPLTLAPRTSWTLDGVDYDLTAATRDSARTNAAVPVTFRLLSRSDQVIDDAALSILVSLDGTDAVDIVRASSGCSIDGAIVTCAVAPIDPRGTGVVRIVARGLDKGALVYEVTEMTTDRVFGRATVEVVPAPRAGSRR